MSARSSRGLVAVEQFVEERTSDLHLSNRGSAIGPGRRVFAVG
jgi:hypothetical protein